MHLKTKRKNVGSKKIYVESTKLKDKKLLEAFQKDLHNITFNRLSPGDANSRPDIFRIFARIKLSISSEGFWLVPYYCLQLAKDVIS